MELAYSMAARPGQKGILVLPDVAVTPKRLEDELGRVSAVLRPELAKRLMICAGEGERLVGIPKDPDPETRRAIADLVASLRPRMGAHFPRPDYSFVVMGLLVHQWLLNKGPMTTKWLMQTAG